MYIIHKCGVSNSFTKDIMFEPTPLNQNYSVEDQQNMMNSFGSTTSDFYWEGEGQSLCLRINPSKRVSITNDPYTELLTKQRTLNERWSNSDSDNLSYSDDDTYNTFDTDSIHELELECLESNLHEILEEEKLLREMKQKKQK